MYHAIIVYMMLGIMLNTQWAYASKSDGHIIDKLLGSHFSADDGGVAEENRIWNRLLIRSKSSALQTASHNQAHKWAVIPVHASYISLSPL